MISYFSNLLFVFVTLDLMFLCGILYGLYTVSFLVLVDHKFLSDGKFRKKLFSIIVVLYDLSVFKDLTLCIKFVGFELVHIFNYLIQSSLYLE